MIIEVDSRKRIRTVRDISWDYGAGEKSPPALCGLSNSRALPQMKMEQLEQEVEAMMNGESPDNSRETIEELTRKNLRLQGLLEQMLYELCEFCAEASDGNHYRCTNYAHSTDGRKRCNQAKYGTCSTWGVICAARRWNLQNKQTRMED